MPGLRQVIPGCGHKCPLQFRVLGGSGAETVKSRYLGKKITQSEDWATWVKAFVGLVS
jgi:hypothetical protein